MGLKGPTHPYTSMDFREMLGTLAASVALIAAVVLTLMIFNL